MATREELKQIFANGQMATGEKFANLIDSMKVVQLPVVDPQALGTSLSFIDSISQDADGKITVTKKRMSPTVGSFRFVANDATAEAAFTAVGAKYSGAISGVSPSADTLGVILLMNDDDTTPTKTMMITTEEVTPATNPATYQFVYVGDLQSALSSGTLTIADIVNNLTDGGSDKVLSAEMGKALGDIILGGDVITDTVELVGEGKPIYNISRYNYLEFKDYASEILGWNRKSCYILRLSNYPGAYKVKITGNTTSTGNQPSALLFAQKDISSATSKPTTETMSFQDAIDDGVFPAGIQLTDAIKILSSGQSTEINIPTWANFVYVAYRMMGNNNLRTPTSFKFVCRQHENGMQDNVDALQEDMTDINERVEELERTDKPNMLHLTFVQGAVSYILSPFNENYDIKLNFTLKRSVSPTHNQSFNFVDVKLVDKSTSVETNIHTCGDDICPSNFNGTYLGGNHGNAGIRKLTITNHGLTYSNIGEVWTYGTNGQATILGIIDNNNILAVSKNSATYPKFSYSNIPVDTILSRNGASMTVEASESYQWFSSTNTPSVDVLCDGELITEDGDYYFDTLKICESYDIMNTEDQISEIRDKVGTFEATPNPASLESTVKTARHSIIYQFKSAKDWIIATTFTAYQNITFSRFGFTQQMTLPWNNMNLHLYIPKTLPIQDDESTTFDFRTCPSYTSHSGILWLTESKWEDPELPPDRWMTYNDAIALHSGFLFDYGVGGNNRKNCVNEAFYLPATNKIYINGIDQKITVNAGDSYSGICWRTYIDRTKVMSDGVISLNKVEYDNKLYIYADFNQTGVYEIEIPDAYLGITIEVFEKRDNVTLLTPISNRKVLVKVSTANPLYGYIVMQIKK